MISDLEEKAVTGSIGKETVTFFSANESVANGRVLTK